MNLVLSLFPGIGLLDMAFEQEGFCVVRGPDVLWGGDIRNFHPPAGKFDGVIGGPPCQAFSTMQFLNRSRSAVPSFGNMIPEFERVIHEARPTWFVMENVINAPAPRLNGYAIKTTVVNNRQFGEKQSRTRKLWTPFPLHLEVGVFEHEEVEPAVLASELSKGKPLGTRKNYPNKRTFADLCELQGLPRDFDLPGFTVEAKGRAVGNGVPLPMGRAIAKAVRAALGEFA